MNKTLAIALAAAGIAVAGSVFASAAPVMMTGITNPWYVGIGANYTATQTDTTKWQDTTDAGVTTNFSSKLNSQGWGGNIFVGYLVNHYFGTELGFSYLGTDKYRVTNTTTNVVVGNSKYNNQWNVHFVGNAYLPVTDWFQPYIFAGVAYLNYNQSFTPSVGTSAGDRVASNNYGGFGLIYGAGLQFYIQQFGIRVSYTRQDDNTTSQHNAAALDYLSLDVLYRFGS